MRTGRQTLATIEDAIGKLRGEETQIDTALRSVVDDEARLRQERTAVFRELARVKLDEMAAGRLVRDLDAAETRAAAILEDRRQRLIALAGRREAAGREVKSAEAARHAAAAAVEASVSLVEEKRSAAEQQVRTTPAWIAANDVFMAADKVATEAERKASASEAELGAKKKPYDDDKLFVYLWRAGFGTPQYRSGHLVRMVDRMIADFIGFNEARANYAMIDEIVLRLREHATGKRAAADATRADLAAVERAAMVAAGIESDEKALVAARHKLAAAESDLESKRKQLAGIDQNREAMLTGVGDPTYTEALQTIASADERDDLATLTREARRTQTQADEALVARIAEIDRRLSQTGQEKEELRRSAKTLADRRVEVERTRDRFRSAGYDHPHATFGNDNQIGEVLGQVLEGVVRSGVLWDIIRGGFSTRPPQGRPEFGAPTFPFPFPVPGGGSSGPSGGGWREPESRGGWFPSGDGGSNDRADDNDGFTTGGSF